MDCRCDSAANLKCCSMKMTFDPLYKLLNSDMFCFLHNRVCLSWYSEINVVLILLIHRDGSLRTCLVSFNMFRCPHATFCGFVSAHGFPCTRWICDMIMFPLIKSVAIKLGTFQGFFTPFVARVLVPDSWVLGFGWIRWMSLLLLATSESKLHVQLYF